MNENKVDERTSSANSSPHYQSSGETKRPLIEKTTNEEIIQSRKDPKITEQE